MAASFQYDATGRRRSKTVGGVSTSFLYDGDNVVQEQSSATANILSGGLDEFFTRSDSSSTTSLITNAIGSTIALTDSSGAVQTQYTFDPFGNMSTTGTASSNSSQFTGRENDGTGLHYYRARYFSPSSQRFISEDPIGVAGGDENLYAYVINDPVNSTDPNGLERLTSQVVKYMPGPTAPPLGGRSCSKLPFNPAKLASATINFANAGRLYAAGAIKIGAACGVEGITFGTGTLPAEVVLAWGLWNLKGAEGARRRGTQQWNEALNESGSDASWKNFVGVLPGGTRFDDRNEPNICTYYNQKLTDYLNSMPEIKMSHDKMGRDRW